MDTKLTSSETWLPVVGFEGFYEVSNYGNVRSVDHLSKQKRDSVGRAMPARLIKGRVIRQRLHQFGYLVVTLSVDGKHYTRTVHKLVAEAFIGKRDKDEVVRHLDGNPKNNRISNLSYGSQKQNMRDAITHGTVERGEKRYNAKLSNEDIVKMKMDIADGMQSVDVSKKYGVSEVYVCKVINNTRWKSIGGDVSAYAKNHKLDAQEREIVIDYLKSGGSLRKAAKLFNVSYTQIRNIKNENRED